MVGSRVAIVSKKLDEWLTGQLGVVVDPEGEYHDWWMVRLEQDGRVLPFHQTELEVID